MAEGQRWAVAKVDEIPVGRRKIVWVKGRSVGVFNIAGRFVAILNVCPHEHAPICMGRVGGTTLKSEPGEYQWGHEGRILACPWHGWEFDLLTGQMLAEPKIRLRHYPVSVEDGTVYVQMG